MPRSTIIDHRMRGFVDKGVELFVGVTVRGDDDAALVEVRHAVRVVTPDPAAASPFERPISQPKVVEHHASPLGCVGGGHSGTP